MSVTRYIAYLHDSSFKVIRFEPIHDWDAYEAFLLDERVHNYLYEDGSGYVLWI